MSQKNIGIIKNTKKIFDYSNLFFALLEKNYHGSDWVPIFLITIDVKKILKQRNFVGNDFPTENRLGAKQKNS